jgi:hypothetical protein
LTGAAQAIEIDTGNPDLTVRWDNSVRLNLAQRVEARDPKIGNSALSDEGTYSSTSSTRSALAPASAPPPGTTAPTAVPAAPTRMRR